jgi:glycosyltransferase involved in cell wall biosynthesis
MPCVSVVITALNAEALIGETLDSVLAQDFSNLEIIVVDGGSTDRTRDVVSSYPAPVRLVAGERLTKSAGKNLGIRAARGEYIALVDADDCWLPNKLTRQLEYFKKYPACAWVYSDCLIVHGQSKRVVSRWSSRNHLPAGNILEALLFDCFVPSPTPLIRRSAFEEVGFFDESFLRHEPEDWDLWLRFAARFPVGVIREPLAQLRVHPESLTAREDLLLTAEGALAVVRRAFERNPQLSMRLRTRVFSYWRRCFGRGLLAAARPHEARQFFSEAIEQRPFNVSAYLLWASTWLGRRLLLPLRNANRMAVNLAFRIRAARQRSAPAPRE